MPEEPQLCVVCLEESSEEGSNTCAYCYMMLKAIEVTTKGDDEPILCLT